MIKHYHWKARPNWGDELGSLLLKHFARLDTQWSYPDTSDIVSVGSVIDILPKDYKGIIFGSGKLRGSHITLPKEATVLGLRGPLSAKGIKKDIFLGDPGLLADELVATATKKYNLCIVPHWSDTELANRPEFLKYSPIVINSAADPLEVVKIIGESRKIITSSLHGMILADAFSIPRRLEYSSQLNKEGGLFKFKDYCASIGLKLELGITQEANRFKVEDRKHEIYDAYRSLGAILWN